MDTARTIRRAGCCGVDYDGNVVVADEITRGRVSEHAPEILRRRAAWWEAGGESNTVSADPSVVASHGLSNRLGQPASIRTEYADHGMGLALANSDREARVWV